MRLLSVNSDLRGLTLKKTGQIATITSIAMMALIALVVLDELVFQIGLGRYLAPIVMIIMGITLCLLYRALMLWRKRGLSYRELLFEMLTPFSRCPRNSKEKQGCDKGHQTPRQKLSE